MITMLLPYCNNIIASVIERRNLQTQIGATKTFRIDLPHTIRNKDFGPVRFGSNLLILVHILRFPIESLILVHILRFRIDSEAALVRFGSIREYGLISHQSGFRTMAAAAIDDDDNDGNTSLR